MEEHLPEEPHKRATQGKREGEIKEENEGNKRNKMKGGKNGGGRVG